MLSLTGDLLRDKEALSEEKITTFQKIIEKIIINSENFVQVLNDIQKNFNK